MLVGPRLGKFVRRPTVIPVYDTSALNYNLQTVTHLPQYNVQFSENQ